jgi:hypothetical protein
MNGRERYADGHPLRQSALPINGLADISAPSQHPVASLPTADPKIRKHVLIGVPANEATNVGAATDVTPGLARGWCR